MKKSLSILFCFMSTLSLAQDGFFLQPEIGLGITNTKIKSPVSIYQYPWGLQWNAPVKSVFTYNPQILIGYRYKKLNFSAGLSFIRTGYREDSVEGAGGGATYSLYRQTQYYNHITVPFAVGYRFKISNRLYFNPNVGGAFAYTYATTLTTDNLFELNNKVTTKVSNSEFNELYHHSELFALAMANFEYLLTGRLSIVAGPEAQYMLTSLLKDKRNNQQNYAYTFNAGVTWHFSKHAKKNEKKGAVN